MRREDGPERQKAALRHHMRALRRSIPAEQRAAWSAIICRRALQLAKAHSVRTAHVYLAFGDEVDADPLIRAMLASGMQVVVPIYLSGSTATPCARITSLDEAAFTLDSRGLRHPRSVTLVAPEVVDAVFAPLLAFGPPADGRPGIARLGRGSGYYDRLLAQLRPDALKAGLAFACQRVPTLPVAPHDALLDVVVTEAD